MRRPIAIAFLLLTTAAAVTAPTTAPTTAPSTAPAAALPPPIGLWFDQLSDPDPAVRDAAQERLMGLPVGALPDLRAIVARAQPLHPAQAAVLYEIVRQVFLAADPYRTDDELFGETHYIMGQNWPSRRRRWWTYVERMGVPVVDRWPGFPARRLLRDGDMILGVYNDPSAPAGRPPDVLTHQPDELVTAIRECPTLPVLTLSVLRDGRVLRVTAVLVVEPTETVNRPPATVAGFLNERQRRADDYWRAQFAPIAGPGPSIDPADGNDR